MKNLFGSYKLPFKYEDEKFTLIIEKQDGYITYYRKTDEEKEKVIAGNIDEIQIHPVEPVNTPEFLAPYLEIEFEKPVEVLPKVVLTVFLKFPVEIGVFISYKKEYKHIDIFSFAKKKFTLYGEIPDGILCKYYKTPIYFSKKYVKPQPLTEGVLKVELKNETDYTVKMTKAVFDVYYMKLFFKENKVISDAVINIVDENKAETVFIEKTPKKGYEKANEVFLARKLLGLPQKFVMEYGL